MNAFRKRVRLVTRLIFATATIFISTVATPCLAAPQKTYSMNVVASATYHVDPTSLQPAIDVPVPISVTIKNESPPSTANSNISSFSFSVAGMTIFSIDANVRHEWSHLHVGHGDQYGQRDEHITADPGAVDVYGVAEREQLRRWRVGCESVWRLTAQRQRLRRYEIRGDEGEMWRCRLRQSIRRCRCEWQQSRQPIGR